VHKSSTITHEPILIYLLGLKLTEYKQGDKTGFLDWNSAAQKLVL
jgi:hypothetical protein